MKILAFLLTSAAVLALPFVDAPSVAPSCVGIEAPPPKTSTIFDPAAVKYSGPYCAEGETCEPFVDAGQPGVEVRPDGVLYTFTDVGELRAVERDGAWVSEELRMLPAPPPACWAWQWVEVAP